MTGHVLYLVGGPPRVGKSALAQRLLRADGIPWLPTDVIRRALRRVLPELDAVDQDPVDAARLADVMFSRRRWPDASMPAQSDHVPLPGAGDALLRSISREMAVQ